MFTLRTLLATNWMLQPVQPNNIENQMCTPRLLFIYIVIVFLLVRIWILIASTQNVTVITISSFLTFFLLVVWIRWKYQNSLENRLNQNESDGEYTPRYIIPAMSDSLSSSYDISKLKRFQFEKRVIDGSPHLIPFDGTLSDDTYLNQYVIGQECSICLSEYSTGETIIVLPCDHLFHLTCGDEWLKKSQTCPLCKALVAPDVGGLELTPVIIENDSNDVLQDITLPMPRRDNNSSPLDPFENRSDGSAV